MWKNKKDRSCKMIVAYARVSTGTQETDNQMYGIKRYAEYKELKIDKEVCEVVKSVAHTRKIYALVDELKDGDTLIVSELSRVGRNLKDLITITEKLIDKNVKLVLVKEMIELSDDNPAGKLQLQLFGAFAEYERAMIRQRTQESMAAKRAAGISVGRPKGAKNKESKLEKFKKEILRDLGKGISKTKVAKLYDTNRVTLNKMLDIWASEDGIITNEN
jgi:DNA invertase Pin-like site-specific DNA recombinase